MTDAIQSDRNSGSPNGAQGETEGFPAIGATTGMLIISATLLSGGEPGVPARPPRCRTLRLRSGQARETPVAPLPSIDERRTTNDRRPTTASQTATPAAATPVHNKPQSPPPESPPH